MARVCSGDFGDRNSQCFTTLDSINISIAGTKNVIADIIFNAGKGTSGERNNQINLDGLELARLDLIRQLQEEEEEINRQISIQDEIVIDEQRQTLNQILQPQTTKNNDLRNALLIGGALLLIL